MRRIHARRERNNSVHKDAPHYAGSIVLGLNDALVEITGVLAGMTFAFRNTETVLLAGCITGVAASLSMAASEYLEAKQDAQDGANKHPLKSSIYTGIAYLCATFLLVLPFGLVQNPYLALSGTLAVALIIIATFTYYVSRLRKQHFMKNFLEMATISMGVAIVSFLIGLLLQK